MLRHLEISQGIGAAGAAVGPTVEAGLEEDITTEVGGTLGEGMVVVGMAAAEVVVEGLQLHVVNGLTTNRIGMFSVFLLVLHCRFCWYLE